MCIDNIFKSWNEINHSVFTQAWKKIQGIEKSNNNDMYQFNQEQLLTILKNLEIDVNEDDLPEFIRYRIRSGGTNFRFYKFN
ncbi:hypothetical protein A3Q56_08609 [Intoshia linei]|uniref:Uncharacterized protein n=1 Tax=Intoshia linei TaxID=1819745 RepID=A0A177AQM5_9BILA|nr:hypothetical protein A3Q56_08609 [Intoshia linei]